MSELVQRRKAVAEEVMHDGICEAATRVLAEVGFTTLTMDRVAESAGVSKGTLYNYFEDKDALVLEVIDRAFSGLVEAADVLMAQPGGPRAKLVGLVRLILSGVEERRALGQAICSSELSPRLAAGLRVKQLRLRGRFIELFRQARQAGQLRAGVPGPEELGRLLGIVLDGMIDERMLHSSECPPVEKDVSAIDALVLRFWFREPRR